MKINVEINNPADEAVDKKFVKKVAAAVIKNEAARFGAIKQMEVSVVFVSPAKIRQLNKKYRRIDCLTDVLSFSGDGALPANGWSLGELVVCVKQVKTNAKELKTTFAKELAWVIIHGILHLFDYDHVRSSDAARIKQKEKSYLTKLKFV
jgi:probable rRNA maturation factor